MTENNEIVLHSDKKGVEAFKEAIVESTEEIKDFEVVDSKEVETKNKPMEIPKNIPYRKILNDEGDLVNPITKEEPYITAFITRGQMDNLVKSATRNPKNNKRGIRLIVTKTGKGEFTKTEVTKQRVEANTVPIIDMVEGEFVLNGYKYQKARTIIHNKIQSK